MMVMDAGQIVREYRAAKHKRHEISVLAQLNCCRESEILAVLEEGGVPPKEMPRKKRKPEPETEAAVPETAAAEPETAAAVPGVYEQIAAMIREAEAARQEALRQADAAEEQLRKIREQLEQLAAMSGGTSDV